MKQRFNLRLHFQKRVKNLAVNVRIGEEDGEVLGLLLSCRSEMASSHAAQIAWGLGGE